MINIRLKWLRTYLILLQAVLDLEAVVFIIIVIVSLLLIITIINLVINLLNTPLRLHVPYRWQMDNCRPIIIATLHQTAIVSLHIENIQSLLAMIVLLQFIGFGRVVFRPLGYFHNPVQ